MSAIAAGILQHFGGDEISNVVMPYTHSSLLQCKEDTIFISYLSNEQCTYLRDLGHAPFKIQRANTMLN